MSATIISLIEQAFSEGRNSTSGTDRHYAGRAWNNSAAKRQAEALEKERLAALDEHQTCRPDGKPVPITGTHHGPGIPDQFRLLRSLVGTRDARGLQNMRDVIDYLESVCPKEPPTPATPEEIATAIELFGFENVEIDSDAQASHGDDGTWVSAWVLIPNDEDEEEDE